MRLPLLLVLTLALPVTASAGNTYSGCGATFNTCASAALNAVQRPDGTWRVTVTVRNLSYSSAQGADRSAVIWGVYLTGIAQGTTSQIQGITGPQGQDLGLNFTAFCGGDDPTGCATSGVQGYIESIDDQGNTVSSQWTGVADPRCAVDPECASARIIGSPTDHYLYVDGAITFSFDLSSWSGTEGIQIETRFPRYIGETYDLQPDATVTPEPGTMLLLGSGIAGVFGARRRRRVSRVS